MTKSQFNNDIQNEQVVNRLINKKLLESEIVDEIIETTPQENWAGVDFRLKSKKIFGDDKKHNVDYKSAINYRKTINDEKSINTFAFELQYLGQRKNNRDGRPIRDGWLFGNQYNLTEYYLLSWIWVLEKEKLEKNIVLEEDDIAKIEILIVRKNAITDYLNTISRLNINTYKTLINNFKQHVQNKDKEYALNIKTDDNDNILTAEISLTSPRQYKEGTLKGKPYQSVILPKLFYSKFLSEEPINVVIEKDKLIELSEDKGYHKEFIIKHKDN